MAEEASIDSRRDRVLSFLGLEDSEEADTADGANAAAAPSAPPLPPIEDGAGGTSEVLPAEREKASFKDAVGESVHGQLHSLAGFQQGRILSGEGEVDFKLREVLQGDERCSGGNIVTQFDLSDSRNARERSAYSFVVQSGFGFGKVG